MLLKDVESSSHTDVSPLVSGPLASRDVAEVEAEVELGEDEELSVAGELVSSAAEVAELAPDSEEVRVDDSSL